MNELVESAALVETCCLCKIFACLWICNNNVMDFHIFFSILFSSNGSISIASLHRLIPSMIPFFITVYVCLIAGAFPNTYHLVFASRKCRTHSFTTAQNPFAVMSHIRILSILIKMLCLFSLSHFFVSIELMHTYTYASSAVFIKGCYQTKLLCKLHSWSVGIINYPSASLVSVSSNIRLGCVLILKYHMSFNDGLSWVF